MFNKTASAEENALTDFLKYNVMDTGTIALP